jgi:hypothetical protein
VKRLALLLLACAAGRAAAADDAEALGRLFFTPEQRRLLERQHRQSAQAERRVRLDGIAWRAGNPATHWVNGQPRADLPQEAVALRVGESIDPVTREKTDALPAGSVLRHGQSLR